MLSSVALYLIEFATKNMMLVALEVMDEENVQIMLEPSKDLEAIIDSGIEAGDNLVVEFFRRIRDVECQTTFGHLRFNSGQAHGSEVGLLEKFVSMKLGDILV